MRLASLPKKTETKLRIKLLFGRNPKVATIQAQALLAVRGREKRRDSGA